MHIYHNGDLDSLKAELMEILLEMETEDQAALMRVATYLATLPDGTELSISQLELLFEQAKRVH